MNLRRVAGLMNPFRAARYAGDVWRNARRTARENDTSVARIVREQVALNLACGLRRDEYYSFGLYDPRMAWDEKLAFLSASELRRLWYVLTPARYHHLYKNKLLFKKRFGAMGFPVARLYGVYDPDFGRTEQDKPLRNAADIAAWMAESGAQEAVFKPVESAEGRMVVVFGGRKKEDPSKFVTLDGQEYGPERIEAFMNDPRLLAEAYPEGDVVRAFLVEERIRQHPAVSALAGQTLCSVRVLTVTTPDGKGLVIAATFKLQAEPIGKDNMIAGSLVIPVDLRSGELGEGRRAGEAPSVRQRNAPGTNVRFAGVRLPFWPELRELALRAAEAFPRAHSVGWDIAIAENGPMLVEGNTAWGGSVIQLASGRGLMQGEFKALCAALERAAQGS